MDRFLCRSRRRLPRDARGPDLDVGVQRRPAPVNLAGGPASDPLDGIAPQFGLHAGYDQQFAARWVAGVEASLGLGSQTSNLNGVTFTPGVTPLSLALLGDNFAFRTGWDGSARARLGFLVTPSALVYATGGAAWQRYDVT